MGYRASCNCVLSSQELRRIQRAQRRRSRKASLRANANRGPAKSVASDNASPLPTVGVADNPPMTPSPVNFPNSNDTAVGTTNGANPVETSRVSASPTASLFSAAMAVTAKRRSLSHSHSHPQLVVPPGTASPEKFSESSASAGRSTNENDSEVMPVPSGRVSRRFSSFGPSKRLSMSLEGRPRTVSIESVNSSEASVISVSDLAIPGEPRTSVTHSKALRNSSKQVLEPLAEAAEEEQVSPAILNENTAELPRRKELDHAVKGDSTNDSVPALFSTLSLPHVSSDHASTSDTEPDISPPPALPSILSASFSAAASPHVVNHHPSVAITSRICSGSDVDEVVDSGAEAPPTSSPDITPPTSSHGHQPTSPAKLATSLTEKVKPLTHSRSSSISSTEKLNIALTLNHSSNNRNSVLSPSSNSSSSSGGFYTRDESDAQLEEQLSVGLSDNVHSVRASDSRTLETDNVQSSGPDGRLYRPRGVTFARNSVNIEAPTSNSSSQGEQYTPTAPSRSDNLNSDTDHVSPLRPKFDSHSFNSRPPARTPPDGSPMPLLYRAHSLHMRRSHTPTPVRELGGDPFPELSKTRSLTSTDQCTLCNLIINVWPSVTQ